MPAPPSRPTKPEQSPSVNLPLVVGAGGVIAVGVLVWFVFLRSGEAHVGGRVTLDDQPLAQAQVVFVGEAEQNQAPLVAVTDSDGRYKLIGHKSDGVRPGQYKVTVTKMALRDGTLPKGEALDEARQNAQLQNLLPAIYADPEQTPLQYDIRSGNNTVHIPLKKKP